jgi:hypothetical protein
MKDLNQLSSTSLGRILLHLGCAIRRPSHWQWHWHGIQRELPTPVRSFAAPPPIRNP